MRKLLIVIVCLQLLCGCKYKYMTHLSDEDLEWTSFFVQDKDVLSKSSNGIVDTLRKKVLFKAISGIVDTLRYIEKRTYNDTSQYYFSEEGGDKYEANSSYTFSVCHNGKEIDGLFVVIRRYGLDSLRCFYHFAGLFTDDTPCGLERSLPLDTLSLCLNGKTYTDVFVADSSNSHYSTSYLSKEYEREGMQIEKFAVSKTKGVIYYKYKDGEEFFKEES